MDDETGMGLALEAARRGVWAGQTPFGACIARGDEVLATEHNRVWADTDPSAHAEVCAIRAACEACAAIALAGTTIYSTTEPCPMCFSAIHWARIERIVHGARVSDARAFGFNELQIENATMKRVSGSAIAVTGDVEREAALALFRDWARRPESRPY